MVIAPLFKVATVFKFDVAQAIIESNSLTSSVENLSNAAGRAVGTIESLGMSYVASFTGIGGGILGMLGSAIRSSDSFTKSQLSFTNIMSANLDHLTGNIGSFTDQMLVAKRIQNDIIKDARKWGIPANALLDMTKQMSAFLIPKGLAGENFAGARDFSRNLLKSAPILGINPTFAGQQSLRAIEGQAGFNNPVFRRLLTEAPEPFKAAGVSTAKQFNALTVTKRFNIMNEAMNKFSSNMKVLEFRTKTIDGLFIRISDTFSGFASILKPLGDVLIPPIVKMLDYGIKLMQTKGLQLVKEFARFLKPLVENPKKLMIGLMQISNLSKDIAKAAGITALVASLSHLQVAFAWFKTTVIGGGLIGSMSLGIGKIPILGALLTMLWGVFGKLIGKIKLFMSGGFFAVFSKMLGVFGLLVIMFQALSRGAAMAKFDSITTMIEKSVEIANAINRIKESFVRIMAPLNAVIDGWARIFAATIFNKSALINRTTSLLVLFADTLEVFSMAVLHVWAVFRGVVAGLVALTAGLPALIYDSIISGFNSGNFFSTEGFKTFSEGIKDMLNFGIDEYRKTIKDNLYDIDNQTDDKSVANNITNINKVEINQQFKEQQEPDRIAFVVADHLLKLANNRRSASGRTLSSGLRGGSGVQTI